MEVDKGQVQWTRIICLKMHIEQMEAVRSMINLSRSKEYSKVTGPLLYKIKQARGILT